MLWIDSKFKSDAWVMSMDIYFSDWKIYINVGRVNMITLNIVRLIIIIVFDRYII